MRMIWEIRLIAEEIVGVKAREITTNYKYWVKRSLGKTGNFPQRFLDKLFFYFFLLTSYVFYFTASINREGIIYIPSIYLQSKNLSVKVLVHELNHYKFPELSEKEIRSITKEELKSWKKSLMR